jgi:hypothetical protein
MRNVAVDLLDHDRREASQSVKPSVMLATL